LSQMIDWQIERIVNFRFAAGDLCKDGFVHFGFHDREGRQYVVEHQKHFLGLISENGKLTWTAAGHSVFDGVPNIRTELKNPMYVDTMPDETLVCSNFGNNRLYRINPGRMESELFADGSALGMKYVGNCVVDDEGCVWVNEVEGCKVWRFSPSGKPVLTLGNGKPGFQSDAVEFENVRFNWIYDIRRGPDGNIYVLDSKNFAIRMIDVKNHCVQTLAGTGRPGYDGDGGNARLATFGSNPDAHYDGPISLSLDEDGNIFVGDRYNRVVRMVHGKTRIIRTIAGDHESTDAERNDPEESNPLKLKLPKISSMDYHNGRLFVPTDLTPDLGDLIVLRKS
jgi:hypothetical protein